MKVKTSFGREVDFEAACQHMDGKLCDDLYWSGAELLDNQRYFEAYADAHKTRFGSTWVCDDPNGQW